MGLDMYLYRRRYIQNWEHTPAEERSQVSLKIGGKKTALVNPTYIYEQVAYWRKANQIHKFFVDLDGGKDECQQIYVSDDNLVELASRCQRVLIDHKLAADLLPTEEGFFFGGTEYDEYYFKDLKDTLKLLEPLIKIFSLGDSGEYVYQASW